MTISFHIADVPVTMVLSRRPVDDSDAWAQWGELDNQDQDSIDSEDQEDDLFDEMPGSDLVVQPWQTLLLIDDETVSVVQNALIGLGMTGFAEAVDSSGIIDQTINSVDSSRRPSKASTFEAEDSALLHALITACDATKP